jgi:hypothetical protein
VSVCLLFKCWFSSAVIRLLLWSNNGYEWQGEEKMAVSGIQLWYTAVVYSCGIQLWYTTVVYSCGIQLWYTAVVYNCGMKLLMCSSCLVAVTKPMRALNSSFLRQRFETVPHITTRKQMSHDYEGTLGCQFGYLHMMGTNLGSEISFRNDSITNHDTQYLSVPETRVVTQGTTT